MDSNVLKVEDKGATTKEVEKVFADYRSYARRLRMVETTGLNVSDEEKVQMETLCRKVETTLRLMNEKHSELLSFKYIEGGEVMRDYDVYMKVRVSERTYYRLKWVSVLDFANCLGLTVYKEEVGKG